VHGGQKHSLEQLERIIELEVDAFCNLIQAKTETRLVIVSSEVGAGLTPPNPAARIFRQLAGRVNTRVAAACPTVVLVSAGLPLVLKGR